MVVVDGEQWPDKVEHHTLCVQVSEVLRLPGDDTPVQEEQMPNLRFLLPERPLVLVPALGEGATDDKNDK